MMKSKRPAKIGRTSAAWVSSLLLVLTLGVATPSIAIAQSDAGAAAVAEPVAAADPAPAPEPAADPAPAEPEAPAVEEAPAPATAAAPSALSNLATELMNILIPAFLTLIGLLVAWILNWVRVKFKLNVSDQQVGAWSAIAEKAAGRGAEWARNKIMKATDDKKIPGPDILEVAVNWAVEMGKTFKLPEMGREKLEGLIESHLHAKRVDPDHPLPLEVEDEPADATA